MSDVVPPGIYIVSGLSPLAQNPGDFGYFGLSVHPEKRIKDHLGKLRGGNHENQLIQQFYNDYGKNHIIYHIVEECDLDQLGRREKFHIKQGETYENPSGFNLTPGGEGAGIREGKLYSFEDTQNQVFITGHNLAMFARANPRYNLQDLYRLSRGEIQQHENLIWKKWSP